jgi:hypothetical protein
VLSEGGWDVMGPYRLGRADVDGDLIEELRKELAAAKEAARFWESEKERHRKRVADLCTEVYRLKVRLGDPT